MTLSVTVHKFYIMKQKIYFIGFLSSIISIIQINVLMSVANATTTQNITISKKSDNYCSTCKNKIFFIAEASRKLSSAEEKLFNVELFKKGIVGSNGSKFNVWEDENDELILVRVDKKDKATVPTGSTLKQAIDEYPPKNKKK